MPGSRLSRKDRLEEYRKEKKAAIERNRKKNVVPFRCGKVHHPVDSLAALPPVPDTKNSAPGRNSTVKIVTDKRIPLRATRAATGHSRVLPPVASKTPALRSTKTPALKSMKTPAPRSSTRTSAVKSSTVGKSKEENLIKAGTTPKQTGKSFAPKNFQFSMKMPMPSATHQTSKDEETVETAEEDPVPYAESKPINQTTPKQAPLPRRRSRRISGVQPDPSLTPAQLSLTPARRAKERSVSRDRRKTQGCGMCPDINCKTSDAGHENHPEEVSRKSSRRSLKEDIDNEDTNNVIDENVNKTPDLKELLQATAVIPSTVKRRRTRMSAMKAIEESAQEVDNAEEVLTPVSKIISKIKDTVIQSEKKEDGFKTPRSNRSKQLSDEPMRVMSPLSSVSTIRGSSKRKRSSPEAKNSIFDMFDNLEGSPILAKLEAKLKTNEEITEDDFANENSAPAAKQMKLSQNFDEIASNEAVVDQEASTSTENKHDVPYFRNLLKTETKRLTTVCDSWERKLENNLSLISDEIQGEIRSVIGQGRLVMAERFHQFSGLVDNCEFKRGEKETTCMDLMGFWEMIYFQVEDVDKKFDKLKEIESNKWKEVQPKPVQPVKKKVVKKAPLIGASKAGPSSGLKAMIAAKRKAAMAQSKSEDDVVVKKTPKRKTPRKSVKEVEEDNQFDGGFFKITSPARTTPTQSPKQKTPGSGKKDTPVRRSVGDHLRRSVLQDNTKRRSGLLLSPFISQAARRSLPGPVSPYRSNTCSPLVETTKSVSPLINIVDPVVPLSSPVTKTYSRRGSSSAVGF